MYLTPIFFSTILSETWQRYFFMIIYFCKERYVGGDIMNRNQIEEEKRIDFESKMQEEFENQLREDYFKIQAEENGAM